MRSKRAGAVSGILVQLGATITLRRARRHGSRSAGDELERLRCEHDLATAAGVGDRGKAEKAALVRPVIVTDGLAGDRAGLPSERDRLAGGDDPTARDELVQRVL